MIDLLIGMLRIFIIPYLLLMEVLLVPLSLGSISKKGMFPWLIVSILSAVDIVLNRDYLAMIEEEVEQESLRSHGRRRRTSAFSKRIPGYIGIKQICTVFTAIGKIFVVIMFLQWTFQKGYFPSFFLACFFACTVLFGFDYFRRLADDRTRTELKKRLSEKTSQDVRTSEDISAEELHSSLSNSNAEEKKTKNG